MARPLPHGPESVNGVLRTSAERAFPATHGKIPLAIHRKTLPASGEPP
jgi:hypothetical protein